MIVLEHVEKSVGVCEQGFNQNWHSSNALKIVRVKMF
jgi:hypothetical protein